MQVTCFWYLYNNPEIYLLTIVFVLWANWSVVFHLMNTEQWEDYKSLTLTSEGGIDSSGLWHYFAMHWYWIMWNLLKTVLKKNCYWCITRERVISPGHRVRPLRLFFERVSSGEKNPEKVLIIIFKCFTKNALRYGLKSKIIEDG